MTQPANGLVKATEDSATPNPSDPNATLSVFSGQSAFEAGQRMATALSKSTLMPKDYLGSIPNCMIALEMAARVGCSVLMVAQNLDIIHGRPGWRTAFLIATVNSSGKFTPLRFRFEGAPGTADWGCRAVAKSNADNEECVGPLVTLAMAKAEGWSTKSGSKWLTMPELMLCYRSAAFWTRLYCPELSLGMQTVEEVQDFTGTVRQAPATSAAALTAELLADEPKDEKPEELKGEVTPNVD